MEKEELKSLTKKRQAALEEDDVELDSENHTVNDANMDDGSEIEDVTKKGNFFSSTFMTGDERVPDELYGNININLFDAAHAEAAEHLIHDNVPWGDALSCKRNKFHEAKELDVMSPLPSLSAFQFLNDLMALDLFPGVSSKLL